MSLQLPFGLQLVNPTPVDYYYGPWTDLSAALAGLPSGIRYKGQTVGIYNMGSVEEYWFKDGITDPDLVAKIPDLSPYQLVSEKGQANGYAPLNGSSKIDAIYLPSYVDDVEEYINLAGFPLTGETGKIYVDLTTNLVYRWSGSIYVEISPTSIPTIAQVATAGNLLNSGQDIRFKDGDNQYYTTLSNNQSQGANRFVYLPIHDGQLAYHATGVPLTTNYVLKGTTNGAITSSSLIYDNGTNVGIGTSSLTSGKTQIKVSGVYDHALRFTNNTQSDSTYIDFYYGNANNLYQLFSFGASAAGNFTGTSIGWANSIGLLSCVDGTGKVYFGGDVYSWYGSAITYPNTVGFKNDISGFRIDRATNLQTANLNAFTVNGNSAFGGNFTVSSAVVHIKGSTSDSSAYTLKVDNSSSSALLYVRNDGFAAVGRDVVTYAKFVSKYDHNGNNYILLGQNPNTGSSTLVRMGVGGTNYAFDFGQVGSGNTTSNYGGAEDMYIAPDSPQTKRLNILSGGGDIRISRSWNYSTEGLWMTSTGMGLYTTSPSAQVHIKGGTSDSTAYALKVDNSSSSALLYVKNDGLVTIGDTTPIYANLFSVKKNVSGLAISDFINTNTSDGGDAVVTIGQSASKASLFIYHNSASTLSPYLSSLTMADTLKISASKTGTLDTGNIATVARNIYNITSFIGVNGANTMLDQTGFKISSINSGLNSANTNLFEANGGLSYLKGSTSDSTNFSFISADSSGYENVRFRNDGFKHFRINQNDLIGIRNENTNAGNSAGALMNFAVASGANMEIGVVNGTAWTAYATGANDSFIANGLGAGALNILHRNAGRILFWTGNAPGASNIAAISINSAQNIGMSVDYTTIGARLHVKGSTSDNTAYALKVDNSSSSALLYVQNDGITNIRGVYNVGSNLPQLRISANSGNYTGLSLENSSSVRRFLLYSDDPNSENVINSSFDFRFYANTQNSFKVKSGGKIEVADSSGAFYSNATANVRLTVNGVIDAVSGYALNGTSGFTGTGSYTNFTIQGGIITAAS